MLYINDYTVIAHAANAKRKEVISFKDIIEFSNILYKKLDKNQIYFAYKTTGLNEFEVKGHRFVREKGQIRLLDELDDDFMNEVTIGYPERVQELIMEARREYTKKNCKVLELINQEDEKRIS